MPYLPDFSNPEPGTISCLETALNYLERGWSVLPLCHHQHEGVSDHHAKTCKRPGKGPLIKWKSFQERLPSENLVRSWWRQWPNANVGIALGPVSGLGAVDIDGREGLAFFLKVVGVESLYDLSPTLMFITPNQGVRIFYKWTEGVEFPTKSWKNQEGDELVRILSKGSQTVMPPSVLAAGQYQWLADHSPDGVEVATWNFDFSRAKGLENASRCKFGTNNSRNGTEGERGHCRTASGPEVQALPDSQADGGNGRGRGPSMESGGGSGALRFSGVERARAYLRKMGPCDPRPQHPMDASTHLLKAADALALGFDFDDETCVALLSEWDQGNPCGPYPEAEYRRKISEARKYSKRKHGELKDNQVGDDTMYSGKRISQTQQSSGHADASNPAIPTPFRPTCESFTAQALFEMELPELNWVLPGLLPEGSTILAAPPKAGKSWLALGIALGVAGNTAVLGSQPQSSGDALYLALEDGKRRLRDRLKLLCQGQGVGVPGRLHCATDWPRSGGGGLQGIEDWLEKTRKPKLVIIDTLAAFRDRSRGRENPYEADYLALSSIQQLAEKYHVAILVVHHTRKGKSDDFVEEISGTFGISGGSDQVMLLSRKRGSRQALLKCTGRDLPRERTLKLVWEGPTGLWQFACDVNDEESTEEEEPAWSPVHAFLADQSLPRSLQEIAEALGKTEGSQRDALKKLLSRKTNDGLLTRSSKGMYTLVNPKPKVEKPCH